MTRVLRVLVHNWPLKLAAIGLAMLLYGGLVLSSSSKTLPGPIPVTPVGLSEDAYLLTAIEPVRSVSYFAPAGIQPSQSSFTATVDLTKVKPGSGPQSAPILVKSVDPRITVISIDPDVQTVELDDITTLDIRVEVDRGTPPAGLEIGASSVVPTIVKVTGPASIVRNVVKAVARVVIQPNGLSIDQEVPLTAVDQLGNPVTPVKVEPATAHVKIQVLSDRTQKTVSVKPNITGTPAGGFEVGTVTLTSPTVTVVGNADQLANLTKIDTEPIPVTGLSSKETRDVLLVMPDGVAPLDQDTVHVVIELRPVTATRSFDVGLQLIGADPALAYKLGSDRVLIVLGGSTADLDRLVGSTLVADLEVTDLGVGTTAVTVTAALRDGVTLVSSSPSEVAVTVTTRASPSPSFIPSSAAPSASPGG